MNKYLSYKNYVYKLKVANKNLKSLLNFCSNGFEIIGDYFPSALIHVNSISNQRNWLFINRGYDNEIYIKDLIRIIRHHTMVTYDGLVTTYNISKYVIENNIGGAFVETGTWKGGGRPL